MVLQRTAAGKVTQLIHKEAGRMQRLVHDLLDLAQLEGEHFPLKKQPIVFHS